MRKISITGNHGAGIKSDCKVQFELLQDGGIQVNIKSKVNALYGKSIEKLAREILSYFNIENAKLSIEDTGALDFVLAARIEAAIKMIVDTDKEFLIPLIESNQNSTKKDQFRFSRLYLPGNSPKLMINAGIHKPNGLILDLEDAVAPDKKFEAKFLVRNALRSLNFCGAERMVRINQIPLGLDDLDFIVPHYANLILVPKCESADELHQVNKKLMSSKNNIILTTMCG